MANQTLEALVKPAASPEARPGHSLVVYEESSRGRRFVEVLPPNKFFRPPLLSFGKRYIGYWVMADPHLKLSSVRECRTRDIYAYSLTTMISYRVINPEQLIERFDADPLARLCDRAEALVLSRLEHLDWSAIKEGGSRFHAALTADALDDGRIVQPCIELLRIFALEYGIEVIHLSIGRSLPEGELTAELKAKEVEAQRGMFRAESTFEFEKQHHEQAKSMRGVVDSVVKSVEDMLIRSGEKVASYPEMKRALQELAQVRDLASRMITSAGSHGGGGGVSGGGMLPEMATSRGEESLSRLLGELCSHFGSVERQFRSRLISDSLHLIAESLLDAAASSEILERYRLRIANFLDQDPCPLDRVQVFFLNRLHESKNLGRELRGAP